MRLIQMCGRLVRRETDVGTITVFDRRLAAMQYGRQMLKALPPFTQVIEPLTAPA
jgi:ATP-dependent DNA helicase DinG